MCRQCNIHPSYPTNTKCKTHLVKHYPSGWFFAPNMKRDNIVHWTLWALFVSETMRPEWEEEVDGYATVVEKRRRLEAGYSEEAKSLRLTFDPVVTFVRPILPCEYSFHPPTS